MRDIPPNFQNIKQIAPTHAAVTKAGKWRSMVQAYLANCSFVDSCVGMVLDALEKSPHRENTIVVFVSDHGYHLGAHGLWQKSDLFEGSARVPLIVAGKGVRTKGASDLPVITNDLYPTILEMLGQPPRPQQHLDGLSLALETLHRVIAAPHPAKA